MATTAEEKREGHSKSEINTRAIFRFLLGLMILAAILHVLIWGIFVLFKNEAKEADPKISPLARGVSQAPPAPRLQITPVIDLQTIREKEDHMLDSYGWVDQKNGIVRIPVKEAMKLAIQKNLFGTPEKK